MRKKLQDGWHRNTASLLFGAAVAYSVWHFSSQDVNHEIRFNDVMQKIAFVAAAFAVTAYNLRTRVVDFVLKLKARPRRMEAICREAQNSGKRLTNLVLLFVSTAGLLSMGGFLKQGSLYESVWLCTAAFMFTVATVNFVYVVFAFEKLEAWVLEEHEELAKDAEAERISKGG